MSDERAAVWIKDFGKWQIYRIRESSLFIAIQPEKHWIILGVDMPDLEADVKEAER